MPLLEIQLERDGQEIAVEVRYNMSPGRKGSRDSIGGVPGAGPPLEPDDPPELEIESIREPKTRREIDVTDAEHDALAERCWIDADAIGPDDDDD